jgi:hypothetical protein
MLGNGLSSDASGPLPSRSEVKKLVYDSSFTKWLERMRFVNADILQETLVFWKDPF